MTEFATIKDKITTSDLTHRLLRKYGTSEDSITEKYIVATQVRTQGSYTDRTADAIIVGNWPSAGYEIQGFEIKISRSDWLNELKDPSKHLAVKKNCDRFWLLIASESFVKENELPDDWGMMVAHGTSIRIIKPAPKLTPEPISTQFITGLMRANKRTNITEDLHNQYIQDARREIEARLKKEYDDLKKFVQFISEAFGIELSQNKRWDSKSGKDIKEWVATVRNNYKSYNPEELKSLIESVISGDLNDTEKKLSYALEQVENASEVLSKYKGVWLNR